MYCKCGTQLTEEEMIKLTNQQIEEENFYCKLCNVTDEETEE